MDELCFDVILESVPGHIEKLCQPCDAAAGADDAVEGGCSEPGVLDSFISPKLPNISIRDYMRRFHVHSDASDVCFVLAWAYLERLVDRLGVVITPKHLHRLLFVSWMSACKWHDDGQYTNSLYRRIGGLRDTKLLGGLEAEFLCLLGFDLNVGEAEFASLLQRIGGLESDGGSCLRVSRCPVDGDKVRPLCVVPASPSRFTCEDHILRGKMGYGNGDGSARSPASGLSLLRTLSGRTNGLSSPSMSSSCVSQLTFDDDESDYSEASWYYGNTAHDVMGLRQ